MGLAVSEIRADGEGLTWDRYVVDRPQASGYHLMAWRRVLEEAFGHQTFYLMAKDEQGEVRGVLPLVFLSSRLFGRFLVSMPFLNYGGIVTDSPEAQGALLASGVEVAKELGAAHIELRHQELMDMGWPYKQHKVSMRLELPGQFEILWKGFSSKLRSQVQRAQKEGMTVRIGGEEILGDFYRLYSRNMRDLGTPVYGRHFFETMLQTLPKDTRICTVSWKDLPVAAGFLYGFRNMLEIPWASSDRRYNHLAPNMLLYCSMLEYACRQGFHIFDFGRSTPGSGTFRFKEQWGAKPVPLHWYYWLASGEALPDLSPRNPKYELGIKLWRRLPLSVATWIGPFLSRRLP